MLGMLCGFALNIGVWQLRKVPFTWYVALGSLTSFGVWYTPQAKGCGIRRTPWPLIREELS